MKKNIDNIVKENENLRNKIFDFVYLKVLNLTTNVKNIESTLNKELSSINNKLSDLYMNLLPNKTIDMQECKDKYKSYISKINNNDN
jgi:hypothetical protein